MAQTVICIRMDEDLKREFEDVCSQLGLSMSAAFNIFARTIVREKRIPFEIKLEDSVKGITRKEK